MEKIRIITFTAPTKQRDYWSISLGHGGLRKRKTAEIAYKSLESLLNRPVGTLQGVKTAVKVIYGHGYQNETIPSRNAAYLLYTTACFLEDFITKGSMNSKEKRYLEKANS